MAASPEGDFDGILKLVAEDIVTDSHFENLGKALGFRPGPIATYMKNNHLFGKVTCQGTLMMLREWSHNVPRNKQVETLREVLKAAKLQALADDHLPFGRSKVLDAVPQPLPRDPNLYVTENQIMYIAKNLLSDFYAPLANQLGFSYAEYENIKKKNFMDIKDSTLEILHSWKDKTGGEHNVLKEALEKAECTRLAYTYREVK